MSLITRCPACGTMFKVVTDQLKVSQGWVRCGHCAEVFDGTSHLLPDDISLAPPQALPPEGDAARGPAFASPAAQQPELPPESGSNPEEPAWAPARSFADRSSLASAANGQPDAQDSAADFDPASWRQALLERQHQEFGWAPVNAASQGTAATDAPGIAPSDQIDSEVPDSEGAHDVSFIREARRNAFWKRPLLRGLLGALSLVLLSALALQWVLQQKDSLAVIEPRLAPWLQTMCRYLRCEIRPPRHIASLLIDSSTFSKIGSDAYRLSFTLRNSGVMALEVPALEVTLTDTRDQALVRRVLAPAQFGASSMVLAAHSELSGVVTMKISNDDGLAVLSVPPLPASAAPLPVAGYRILAFYP